MARPPTPDPSEAAGDTSPPSRPATAPVRPRMSAAMEEALGVKPADATPTIDKSVHERLVSHRLTLKSGEAAAAAATVDGAVLREAARAALVRWPFFASVVPEGRIGQAVFDALAAVALPSSAASYLALARDTRPALFEHSVVMALLSARLVIERGAAPAETSEAAAAGLLHDLGMLHIESGLLDSGDRLTGDELKPVYVHPITSSLLVDRFGTYSKTVVRAIVEHHERLDGSGYPRGLAGEAIGPLGRVLALAEVVTAMFDGQRRFPEQRVSLLLRINPRRYDPVHVATVQRLLAATPPSGDDGIEAGSLIKRLLKLTTVLDLWRGSVKAIGRELGGALRELIESVDEQNETLQHMLNDAGVTAQGLSAIAGEVGEDAAFRIELWALAEELLWQLHAAANQLKRRWQAAESGRPHPVALAAWFDAVAALDTGPASR
jgi:HD-GYP domain-containing protein (c-di-GMP phosphodiesterase class II)